MNVKDFREKSVTVKCLVFSIFITKSETLDSPWKCSSIVILDDWEKILVSVVDEYQPHQIYTNKTAIFYSIMPESTLEFVNVNCHGGKMSKKRLTALVSSNKTGTSKLL